VSVLEACELGHQPSGQVFIVKTFFQKGTRFLSPSDARPLATS